MVEELEEGTVPAEGAGEEGITPTPEIQDPPAGVDPPASDPPKDGVQKRIDELTRKRRDAERTGEQHAQDAAYWKGRAEELEKGKTTPTPAATELNPDDFASYADYHKAVAAQTTLAIRQNADSDKRQEALVARQRKIATFAQIAREKFKDFDEVALAQSVPVTEDMFEAAMGDNWGDILYHLGQHTREAARISSLSKTQQIKEIGKLEAKIAATPASKKKTNAPDPPSTVGSGGSPAPKKDDEKSMSELNVEWEKGRTAAIKEGRY